MDDAAASETLVPGRTAYNRKGKSDETLSRRKAVLDADLAG